VPEPTPKERTDLEARLARVRLAREALRRSSILPHGSAQRLRAILLFVVVAAFLGVFAFRVFWP
jgi:ABC-type uncharacterized transport system ATPase subunit